MLVHDVPQDYDDRHSDGYKTIVYAIDENGNYVLKQTVGWEPENIAHSMAWEDIDRRIQDVKRKVIEGKLSPLAFYMERELMSPKRLSGLIGIPGWRIKRHLNPLVFNKISDSYKVRYAEFFKVSVSDFVNLKAE
jgi:hypothetical protein